MTRTLKIECANSFHGTRAVIHVTVNPDRYNTAHNYGLPVSVYVNERQVHDARRKLCGVTGCMCGTHMTAPYVGWNNIERTAKGSRFYRVIP